MKQTTAIAKGLRPLATVGARWRSLNPLHSPWLAAVCLGLLLAQSAALLAQGTGFTFQGRLTDGGAPANGLYDFQFGVRDAATAGNAVGSPLTLNPVGVTNGLFNVTLDFGAGVFTGAARWLEIGARTNGSASAYTVLTPRTPLSPVPYAMFVNTDALAAQLATLASQLASLSNQVSSLTNQVTTLTTSNTVLATQLVTVSNYAATNVPLGVAVVSADALDPVFLGQGLQVFQTVPAPPWVNGTATGVPSGRSGHSAVWTGQQFLVWGGDLGGASYSSSGGAYATASDTWATFSSFQAPSARAGHTAVWTGTEMVIFGGSGAAGQATTNSKYHLGNNEWSAVTTTGMPAMRSSHVALWTGTRMVVFGGLNNTGLLADGGAYDPAGNAWTTLPTTGAPAARRFTTAVWTGTNAIIWGGQGESGELATGARLECTAGVPQSWTTLGTTGAPSARRQHTAVWTGSRMIVWGGQQSGVFLGDGAAYNPATDTWTALPSTGAPVARANHVAVWTGTEMLIYGGEDNTGSLSSGAAFDPAKNTWRTLDTATGAVARTGSTAAWSGSQLVIFGGLSAGTPIASLQRLTPQPAFYFFRKP